MARPPAKILNSVNGDVGCDPHYKGQLAARETAAPLVSASTMELKSMTALYIIGAFVLTFAILNFIDLGRID